MNEKQVLDLLRKLELNQYESQTYFALAKHGTSTAGQISELAKIPRPRVYDVLEKLENSGFVLIQPGRPVTYKARGMDEVLKILHERKSEELKTHLDEISGIASTISKNLSSISRDAKREQRPQDATWTLKGRNAIYGKLSELVEGAKSHVILSTTPSGLDRKSKFLLPALKKARDRGVRVDVITHTSQARETLKKFGEFTEARHDDSPYRFLVADDEHSVLLLTPEAKNGRDKESELAVWLASREFTNNFKRLVSK
ncbi:MAG TPA: helix-turn-helix domain-containing protein [archaeon]|nr:helix-turn-helix domain-containing protein [archaeon]